MIDETIEYRTEAQQAAQKIAQRLCNARLHAARIVTQINREVERVGRSNVASALAAAGQSPQEMLGEYNAVRAVAELDPDVNLPALPE
jgi:hypothetical protein